MNFNACKLANYCDLYGTNWFFLPESFQGQWNFETPVNLQNRGIELYNSGLSQQYGR